ncbi:MAG: hypothetical protein PHT49_03345 [Desulfovibrionales bacterium]|nr:hypothetical protein [Desulfovibrionales bacterium]
MELISELRSQGITISLVGDRLKIEPREKVTPELITKIKTHRQEIARELRQPQEKKTNTAYCSWLKKKVEECGPVCCEERPGRGVTYCCNHLRTYMAKIGRWK